MSITSAQFAILGIAAFALTGLLTWPVRALAIKLGASIAPNRIARARTGQVKSPVNAKADTPKIAN